MFMGAWIPNTRHGSSKQLFIAFLPSFSLAGEINLHLRVWRYRLTLRRQ